MTRQLHTCKPHFETILARELAAAGQVAVEQGDGWVLSEGMAEAEELCFAIFSVFDVQTLQCASVNAMAGQLCDLFGEHCRGEKITAPWPLVFESAAETGLAGRVRVLRAAFQDRLAGKMAKPARLASDDLPGCEIPSHGFFIFVRDYERAFAGRRFRFWGQRRMRDDPQAPSRSYLKVEEAFAILGRSPAPGETVVDLGAAPGGWSYSAARRGAQVLAIDNGPLKGGALNNNNISHLREDAFGFRPDQRPVDWLFCDMIEDPYRVLEEILIPWIDTGCCRRFVVNLKVGKGDPVELIRKLFENKKLSLKIRCRRLILRQLFHDREEITCIGEL
jgi:23S rRNA (cytidine2498-2'-O)-methyltransferase